MIGVITTLVTRGMAALLQSSVELVEWSSEVKVYSVRYILYFVKKCKKNVSLFHWRYILVSQNLRSTLAMARVQDAVFLSRWQNLNEKTVDMKIETLRENVKILNVR